MVTETFFAVGVRDMERASAFYVEALGAAVKFASPAWSSLFIAGVRIGLAANPKHSGGHVGLHFVVSDLPAALAAIERAGGKLGAPPREVAPGVTIADATDCEGNTFTLRAG